MRKHCYYCTKNTGIPIDVAESDKTCWNCGNATFYQFLETDMQYELAHHEQLQKARDRSDANSWRSRYQKLLDKNKDIPSFVVAKYQKVELLEAKKK
jgi:hypothetical protein